MEKMLWTAIAVLWTSLLAGAAFGDNGMGGANGSPGSGVVIQAASLTTPVRNVVVDRMVRPVVEIGQQGSGELAGAALIGAGFVFRALRRRGLV